MFQSHSIDYGHNLLENFPSGGDKSFRLFVQTMVACIIASARERDDQWFTLAMDQFGVSERLLRRYLANGNSVLLANLNQIFRKTCYWIVKDDLVLKSESWILLQLLTQFDPRNTLPELQHDFCALWNEIVQKSPDVNYFTHLSILQRIRHIFITLHPGINTTSPVFATTDPFDPIFFQGYSYPLCDIADHRHLYSVPQLYEMANQGTMLSSGSTSIPPIAPHYDAIPTSLPPSTRPNLSPFPLSDAGFTSPHPADESSPPNVLQAQQCFTSVASSSHAISEFLSHDGLPTATTDLAIACATNGITVISSLAGPIRRSTPRGNVAPLPITVHPVVHGVPSSSPVHIPSNVASAEAPLCSDPTVIRSGGIPNELALPPPASTIVALSISPQNSVSGPDASTRFANIRALDGAQDLDLPSPVELPNRSNADYLSAPGVARGILQSDEDRDPSGNMTDPPHDQILLMLSLADEPHGGSRLQ